MRTPALSGACKPALAKHCVTDPTSPGVAFHATQRFEGTTQFVDSVSSTASAVRWCGANDAEAGAERSASAT